MGWTELDNGAPLQAAEEAEFDALITTDQKPALPAKPQRTTLGDAVPPTTSRPKIQANEPLIVAAIDALRPGDLTELTFS